MDFAEQNQVTPSLVLEHWYYQSKFELLVKSTACVIATGHTTVIVPLPVTTYSQTVCLKIFAKT